SNTGFVFIRKYIPANAATEGGAIATELIAQKPDVIAVFGQAESITGFVVPYEKLVQSNSLGAMDVPFYMLIDSNRVKEVIDGTTTSGVPADMRSRLRGVGVTPHPSSLSVLDAFNSPHQPRYGSHPRSSHMPQAYD